jgi:hypothetical protein
VAGRGKIQQALTEFEQQCADLDARDWNPRQIAAVLEVGEGAVKQALKNAHERQRAPQYAAARQRARDVQRAAMNHRAVEEPVVVVVEDPRPVDQVALRGPRAADGLTRRPYGATGQAAEPAHGECFRVSSEAHQGSVPSRTYGDPTAELYSNPPEPALRWWGRLGFSSNAQASSKAGAVSPDADHGEPLRPEGASAQLPAAPG